MFSSKNLSFIFLAIVLAITLLLSWANPASPTKLRPNFYPVVIPLGDNPDVYLKLWEFPIDELRLYAYTEELGWHAIPSQIDEKRGKHYFDLNNLQVRDGLLNGQDELVFMYKDAGEKAASLPEDIQAQTNPIIEFNIKEIVGSPEDKYVYLFRSTTLPRNNLDYIKYEKTDDMISSDFYQYDHYSSGLFGALKIKETLGGTFEVFTEGIKLRLGTNIGLLIKETALKQKGAPQIIDGPVRVLRKWLFEVDAVVKKFGPYDFTFKFYPQSCDWGNSEIKPPPGIDFSSIRYSFDLHKNVANMNAKMYTPGALADYPNGVPIDQFPDEGLEYGFPRDLTIPGWNWFLQTTNAGSMLSVSYLEKIASSMFLYYKDSATGTNDGTPDSGNDGSWGDTGIKMSGFYSNDPFKFSLITWFAGPMIGPDSAAQLVEYITTPPQISIKNVVPVELVSLVAAAGPNKVELRWQTASETNNLGFDVERKESDSWQKVAFVKGAGTTTQQQSYFYTDKILQAGNYKYRLRQIDMDGTYEYSPVVEATVFLVSNFGLVQNYPNPFNSTTRISFCAPLGSEANLSVFNIHGRWVATLFKGLSQGQQEVVWNGKNEQGLDLPSGTYYCALQAQGKREAIKLVLIK